MKISVLLIIFILLGTLMPSCKKGDQDPFFSLQTRKARIAGEWIEKDLVIGEERADSILAGSSFLGLQKNTYSDYFFKINKDGTWERKAVYNSEISREDGDSLYITYAENALESNGTWSFLGKQNDTYKNKERALIITKKSERTTVIKSISIAPLDNSSAPNNKLVNESNTLINEGSDVGSSVTYDIEMLKSKEMIWHVLYEETLNSKTVDGQDQEIQSNNYSITDEQALYWILK